MNITRLAVERPIATTMVFLIIIVLGITGFRFLPIAFPGCYAYKLLDMNLFFGYICRLK
jgi:hypothetical protein